MARLARACAWGAIAGDGRYRTMRGILERDLDSLDLDLEPEPAPRIAGAFLRGPAAFVPAGDERAEVAGC